MEMLWGDGRVIQIYDIKPQDGHSAFLRQLIDTGNPEQKFRYVILRIDSNHGDGHVQFSAWQFLTSAGAIFKYPEGYSSMSSSNVKFEAGEDLGKTIISDPPHSSMGKACFTVSSYPCYFAIDLHDDVINVSKYRYWRWCSSNDTYGQKTQQMESDIGKRNPSTFSLYLANEFTGFNDQSGWIQVDHQENYVVPVDMRLNQHEAYRGEITIP